MKSLVYNGKEIIYSVRRRKGVRRVSIRVHPEQGVSLTLPWYVSDQDGVRFLESKLAWVSERLNLIILHPRERIVVPKNGLEDLKRRAYFLVKERIALYNQSYNYAFAKIVIRNQKTRWGSCSKNGTLSFNIRLALLDQTLLDYVVVHELCHLKEMNHGVHFWELVQKTVPDYKERRKALRKIQCG